jgi:hypothetical protein
MRSQGLMVEEAVARNDMLFSLSTLRRDCRCKPEICTGVCSFEAKQYGEFHVHVMNLKLPKIVRNVGYGLSDTR